MKELSILWTIFSSPIGSKGFDFSSFFTIFSDYFPKIIGTKFCPYRFVVAENQGLINGQPKNIGTKSGGSPKTS